MLPIYDIQPQLLDAVSDGPPRIVLQAPTGSGKSTQIPQMLRDHPDHWEGRILVLQPRRLAARMLARRVASERGGSLGGEVGYQVRFDNRTSRDTRIVYLTEGLLLRRLLSDPTLEGVSAVVFDEFHERSLDVDLALGLLRDLQAQLRPELLLVVMSATLDTGPLADYLAPATTLTSEGRTFPVDIRFAGSGAPSARRGNTRREPPPVFERAARACASLVAEGEEGDMLVFMPGAYEIRKTIEHLRHHRETRGLELLALHGEMSPDDQDRAVADSRTRKIVVATNIAETSLTIPGIRIVVDGGLAREARYDPARGMNALTIEPISRAAADQRAGRAGRTAPGTCVRLWSERSHAARPAQTAPEIQRVDLAECLLGLAGMGHTPETFPWFEIPRESALADAIRLLHLLGALAPDGAPTTAGRRMLRFPLHPRHAALLLAADELGCVHEAALAAAIAQARPFWLRRQPRDIEARRNTLIPPDIRCDYTALFAAWHAAAEARFDRDTCADLGLHGQAAREVQQHHKQLLDLARRVGLDPDAPPADETTLRRCLLRAFSDQLAIRRDTGTTRCRLANGRTGKLADDCQVRDADLLVATEITEVEGRERNVLLGRVAAVELDWLREDFPHVLREEEEVGFDPQSRQVTCALVTRFGDLELARRGGAEPSPEAAAAFLAREIHAGNLQLKRWNQKVEDWIARVNTLAADAPDLGYTAITDDDRLLLLEQICLGGRTFREVRDRDPWPELRAWLLPGLAPQLDRFAPERVQLPSGRHARIRYATGEPPVASAKLQHFYDMRGQLTIADGRIPCRLELLAPNNRPAAITDNLDSFWEEGYLLVKKDLKGRYPKHEWR